MLYSSIVKKRIRQAFDHVNNHRWDELMKSITPDVHHRFGGAHAIGGERHDRDTLRLWFERLARVLPNLHLKINNIWVPPTLPRRPEVVRSSRLVRLDGDARIQAKAEVGLVARPTPLCMEGETRHPAAGRRSRATGPPAGRAHTTLEWHRHDSWRTGTPRLAGGRRRDGLPLVDSVTPSPRRRVPAQRRTPRTRSGSCCPRCDPRASAAGLRSAPG